MAPRRSPRLCPQIHPTARRRSPRLHPHIQASGEGAGVTRRCSPRLHLQVQASVQGAGVTRRRSPRLHPQIQASGEGAGVTRRCSPRLHLQIQASVQGAGATRRRSPRRGPQVHSSEEEGAGTSPAEPASPLDNDDMLREIFLRLPPQPSSLPRASAVCKRWRDLVTDPRFHSRFYQHHRKPPLVGYFHRSNQGIVLASVLDPPDRIPPQHFDLGRCDLLDCRHGLVLILKDNQKEVVVRHLMTRVQRRVAIPPVLRNFVIQGAVLCAAAAADHVHGSCHSSPFKVVLVSMIRPGYRRPLVCVYSSETGLWGNLISTEATCRLYIRPVVLVGNCLYWLSTYDGILQFDLDEDSLTVIGVPPVTSIGFHHNCRIIEAEEGVIGFVELFYPRFQLWQRNVNAHGVATWVSRKTIEMQSIPGFPPRIKREDVLLLGYDEDTDAVLLRGRGNVYGVQLKLMQSKKLYETCYFLDCLPFKSFYKPGTTFAGEFNGAGMLHDA